MDCPLERDEFVAKVDACLAEEPALRERLSQGNATIRETVDLPASRIARLLAEEA